jgi:putative flippase GtrA
MAEDIAKRLRMMRFWLIGVFIIILAADITIAFLFPWLLRELFFWLGLIIAAALIAITYFVYKWWVSRR